MPDPARIWRRGRPDTSAEGVAPVPTGGMEAAAAISRPIGTGTGRGPYAPTTVMAGPSSRTDVARSASDLDRDRAIARGLARREPQALEALYAATSRACFSVVLGMVGDRGHAEDVQQQVYAELWRRAEEFDPARASLLTWVLIVARSRSLDHLRRRTESPVEADAIAALSGGSLDRGFDDVVQRALVAEALTTIPAEERELLRLRFWAGLSQVEIAERTGVPLGTVKSRMTSGLGRLRSFLADHDREGAQ